MFDPQKPISDLDQEELLQAFQTVWFMSDSPLYETEEEFFSPLREIVARMWEFGEVDIDSIVSTAVREVTNAFPESCTNEYLNRPSVLLKERCGASLEFERREVFLNYEKGIMGQPQDSRAIESPFSQLWLLAASGLLGERHLGSIISLLKLEPPEGQDPPLFSDLRWRILGQCKGQAAIGFIREIWPRRERFGYDDDSILGVLQKNRTPPALDLILELLQTKLALGGRLTMWGVDYTMPSEFLFGFDEDPENLPKFFPALDCIVEQVADPGLWAIALTCEKAGVLPDTTKEKIVAQIDHGCAEAVAYFEKAERGEGEADVYQALNVISDPFAAACKRKNDPVLSKWFDWAMASKYPETKLFALQGLLANEEAIPDNLIRDLAIPFCLPALFATLDDFGLTEKIPAEFLTKAKIAETVIAQDLDRDGVHFPPNRFREVTELVLELQDESDSGNYVVIAATGLADHEFDEMGLEGAEESLYLVGPMGADAAKSFDDPPSMFPSMEEGLVELDVIEEWAKELVAEYS